MFETLFTHPLILARHQEAPCLKARISFLAHCAEQGSPHSSLKKIAWVLLVFSHSIDLSRSDQITSQEIEFAVDHRKRYVRRPEHAAKSRSSRLLFIHIATAWLRFCGRFKETENTAVTAFDEDIENFTKFLRNERGLSNATIVSNRAQLTDFLIFVGRKKILLNEISIHDVDTFLIHQGLHGWSRRSLCTVASVLRSFFHYAETQGCVNGIAAAINAPRTYAQENLPIGPAWGEVTQLVDSFSSDSVRDLRNRAIILLLAVYGLRRGEVSRLCLEDMDWIGEILHVTRPKQRCTQQYPLDQNVGNAILHYIEKARPRCTYRQLFLTLNAPFRPLFPNSISSIVRSRLIVLGIDVPKKGAHCLRHACARHLLAAGFSLKQIGDHLGHRSSSATREYVKVDLDGLRIVAELDLGDLL